MTDFDAIARDAVEGGSRRMRGFFATLSPAQQAVVLAFDGPDEPIGDPAFATGTSEDQRRLRVNDNLDVRRRGGRILVTAGPIQMEISPEEARRAADALSAFAAVADADDVEVEEVRRAA